MKFQVEVVAYLVPYIASGTSIIREITIRGVSEHEEPCFETDHVEMSSICPFGRLTESGRRQAVRFYVGVIELWLPKVEEDVSLIGFRLDKIEFKIMSNRLPLGAERYTLKFPQRNLPVD